MNRDLKEEQTTQRFGGRAFPSNGNRKYKGSEAGLCWGYEEHFGDSLEQSEPGESIRGLRSENLGEESRIGLESYCKNFGFYFDCSGDIGRS